MPEQELYLLQVATCFAAELRTRSPQIVSTEVLNSNLLRCFGDHCLSFFKLFGFWQAFGEAGT